LGNFSQEDEEKGFSLTNSDDSDMDDIQFEDIFDVDKLQAELQKKIDTGDFSEQNAMPGDSPMNESMLGFKAVDLPESFSQVDIPIEVDVNAKKYVIYINSDNINFMENLSTNERKTLINKILKEQNELSVKEKEIERRKKYTINLMIITITVIIAFPILFVLVNKGLEITMDNYKEAKGNFTKLYKQKGKIKPVGSESAENIKY